MYGVVTGPVWSVLKNGDPPQGTGYRIVEIRDEAVPLASGADNRLYVFVLMMITVVILLAAVMYLRGCIRYRKRITELKEGRNAYCGWNLWKLQEAVREAEARKAEGFAVNVGGSIYG